MEKVITAIKTLLEASITTPGSALSDIKKVYFWDPQQIPASCQPAITIQPLTTQTNDKGPGYIQKVFSVEIRLIYNQRQYYNQGTSAVVPATAAAYDQTYKEIQVEKTAHGLKVWDSIVLQVSPSQFSGTYSVTEVLSADQFVVPKDGGAEFTQNLANASYQKVDTENIFAVRDAIRKLEGEDPITSQPLEDTLAGLVMKNPTLAYLDGNGVRQCWAEYAKVESIEYGFTTNRGFPTYEVSVRIKASRVRGRQPFTSIS